MEASKPHPAKGNQLAKRSIPPDILLKVNLRAGSSDAFLNMNMEASQISNPSNRSMAGPLKVPHEAGFRYVLFIGRILEMLRSRRSARVVRRRIPEGRSRGLQVN
jgi:hypothetical protein